MWQELQLTALEFRTKLELHGLSPPMNITASASMPLLAPHDAELSRTIAARLWEQCNHEQRTIAETILTAVDAPRGGDPRVFMLQAAGGCGKSFVANYVAAKVRAAGKHAICVAASAQAAMVLNGGRTAHGQLHIPLNCDETSFLDLSVAHKHEIANAAVLIWDEASMVSDTVADCVNRSFQDIMQCSLPFGGMPVVFLGDFRQLLPIVRGGRGEFHTIQICSWWRDAIILKLQHNWRAQHPTWLQLLDDVGMGRTDKIEIPADAQRQTVEEVIAHVWADAATSTAAHKAVLTLTLEDAAEVNRTIIDALPGPSTEAASNDTYIDCKEPDLYPEEFVRNLHISGIAHGHLQLKVGARYIINRNIDIAQGVVNGAQIICTEVTLRHVIGAAS